MSSEADRLYVGNLSWATSNESLKAAFSQFGNVVEAKVMLDRETGRSRGFGFVTFSSKQEADSAAQGMDGKDLDGRNIKVAIAQAITKERTGFQPRSGPRY
jgi:RNA recognition motif-containing protein